MFLLLQAALFARGGGGGHGGGGHGGGGGHSSGGYHGGGYHSGARSAAHYNSTGDNGHGDLYAFLFIIALVVIVILISNYGHYYVLHRKARQAKRLLNTSSKTDQLWDPEYLDTFVRDIFMRMQRAWMAQDMNLMVGVISSSLYQKYKAELKIQKAKGLYNYIGNVVIDHVKIVGATDHHNNTNDKFTAYIKGTMCDEIRFRKTELVVQTGESVFRDLYSFRRDNGGWYLTAIDSEISYNDAASLTISAE